MYEPCASEAAEGACDGPGLVLVCLLLSKAKKPSRHPQDLSLARQDMVRLISIALHENWRAGCFVERLRRMSYRADEIQALPFSSLGSRGRV